MNLAAPRKLNYFAYGSNMFTARLVHRVHSAEPIGIGDAAWSHPTLA